MKLKRRALGLILGAILLSGCGNEVTDELSQQIGENMSSIDEMGGGDDTLAFRLPSPKLRKSAGETILDWTERLTAPFTIQRAHAVLCRLTDTFDTCTSNRLTRTFSGCTIGSATISGTVKLDYTDAAVDNACALTANGHSIARTPSFTVSGRRGQTLTVSKTGSVGQRIIRGSSADAFTFSNDGIRRVFTDSTGATTYDFTTEVTTAFTLTGSSRTDRSINGGSLKITNNLTGISCEVTATAATWSSSCSCPVAGSWSGNCSNGDTLLIELTGCGSATVTKGLVSQGVSFDRCESL